MGNRKSIVKDLRVLILLLFFVLTLIYYCFSFNGQETKINNDNTVNQIQTNKSNLIISEGPKYISDGVYDYSYSFQKEFNNFDNIKFLKCISDSRPNWKDGASINTFYFQAIKSGREILIFKKGILDTSEKGNIKFEEFQLTINILDIQSPTKKEESIAVTPGQYYLNICVNDFFNITKTGGGYRGEENDLSRLTEKGFTDSDNALFVWHIQ